MDLVETDLSEEARTALAEMTEKERAFWDEYRTSGDLLKAYRVGYSERGTDRTALRHARMVLARPRFQILQAERTKILAERYALTEQNILDTFVTLAMTDAKAFVRPDGTLKDPTEWTRQEALCVQDLEVEEIDLPDGTRRGRVKRIKLVNRKQALDSLAKTQGMFVNRTITEHRRYVVRMGERVAPQDWEAKYGKLVHGSRVDDTNPANSDTSVSVVATQRDAPPRR